MAKSKWTLEACKADALNYKSRREWQVSSRGAYLKAFRSGWLEECCRHMEYITQHGKWTLETCKSDALKYKSRMEWVKNSIGAYSAAHKKGWLEECCGHMEYICEPNKWTLEACKADALNYKSRARWKNHSKSAYSIAHKNKWLDQCCGHMERPAVHNKKWTLEACKIEASKYISKIEWRKSCPSYSAACAYGWLDQCCSHMEVLGGTSTPEQELQSLVKNNNADILIENNKKFAVLPDQKLKLNLFHVTRYELDIYIPKLKLGIEFNGKYWHSFEGLKRGRPNWTEQQLRNYHKDKERYFNSLGISVINIEEKEWEENREKALGEIKKGLSPLLLR